MVGRILRGLSTSFGFRRKTTRMSVPIPVQYLTDDQGKRTGVVLSISDYEKLVEDLDDLAVIAERRNEPSIPHEEFVAELKRDGII